MNESPMKWLERALDATLAVAFVAVPLAFSPALRTFGTLKLLLLEALVGVALVLAAFVPRSQRWPFRAIAIILAAAAVAIVARPDAEGVAATGYLAAVALLAVVTTERVLHWSHQRLVLVVAAPLAVGLVLSLAQGAGVGILAATAAAFGGTHGLAVGTIGNPNENTWYLLLAAVLLTGLARPRARTIVLVAVAVVVLVDRSRAVILVGGTALAAWGCRARTWSPVLKATIAVAITVAVIAAGFAWGGAEALRGRVFLASVGVRMLAQTWGVPQGPGTFARDFPAAQENVLADAPELVRFESAIDHAHFDALELTYEYGWLAIVVIVAIAVAVARGVRRDPSGSRRAAAWTLAMGAGLGLFGYPLFSPASATILALAFALALAPATLPARVPKRSWTTVTWSAAGAALLVLAIHQAKSELAITAALEAHARGDDARGLAAARIAVQEFPSADACFYHGNFELVAGSARDAIASYRRSHALRPRSQTLANLEVARRAGGE
jgi:hypothetical protein